MFDVRPPTRIAGREELQVVAQIAKTNKVGRQRNWHRESQRDVGCKHRGGVEVFDVRPPTRIAGREELQVVAQIASSTFDRALR